MFQRLYSVPYFQNHEQRISDKRRHDHDLQNDIFDFKNVKLPFWKTKALVAQ